jgi:hypothetical protein
LEKLVSDIFNEVDEEVRREKLRQLWERYNVLIIAAALLIVFGVGGWRGYQWWQAKQAAEAGGAFQAAMALSAEGKHAEAETAFAKVAEKGAGGYRELARLQAASELAQRDPKAAVEAYDAITADPRMNDTMRVPRCGTRRLPSGRHRALRRPAPPPGAGRRSGPPVPELRA